MRLWRKRKKKKKTYELIPPGTMFRHRVRIEHPPIDPEKQAILDAIEARQIREIEEARRPRAS